MSDSKIYCLCLNDHHLDNIKKLNYIPVGLGKNQFNNSWLRDNTGDNISKKNPYYGEYTFYYWFWKNELEQIKDDSWIGFAGYRYHWNKDKNLCSEDINKIVNQDNFKDYILREIPSEWEEYEVVLGEEIYTDKWKLSKILKHGKKL